MFNVYSVRYVAKLKEAVNWFEVIPELMKKHEAFLERPIRVGWRIYSGTENGSSADPDETKMVSYIILFPHTKCHGRLITMPIYKSPFFRDIDTSYKTTVRMSKEEIELNNQKRLEEFATFLNEIRESKFELEEKEQALIDDFKNHPLIVDNIDYIGLDYHSATY